MDRKSKKNEKSVNSNILQDCRKFSMKMIVWQDRKYYAKAKDKEIMKYLVQN